jgi:hypothetical protein
MTASGLTIWTIVTESGPLDTLNLSQGVKIQVKQEPQVHKADCLPLNQGVGGSSPPPLTSFKWPEQLEDFSENQGVSSLGLPTP